MESTAGEKRRYGQRTKRRGLKHTQERQFPGIGELPLLFSMC